MKHEFWVVLLAAFTAAHAAGQEQERALKIAAEVEQLAGQQTLWPGFEPLGIPLAIYTGEHTYLFRHPAPPADFNPVPNVEPRAFVMSGRHSGVTSNSSADIGGTVTATLLADGARARLSPIDLAASALHEAFHVFQRTKHKTWIGNEGLVFLYPVDDAKLLRDRRLETLALRRALAAGDRAESACWAALSLDFRRARFTAMDTAFASYERLTELNEGIATYIQLRAAGKTTVEIPAAEFPPARFRERIYATGPALAFVLDRLQPGWQNVLETNDQQYLDQLLEPAAARTASTTCAVPANLVTAIDQKAREDAAAVVSGRTARRQVFDTRVGWRIAVQAADGQPLWPQGFDPLNVERIDGGVLHSRFLRLGNDAGELSMIDEANADVEALTEGVGAHPLFNGVSRVTVAGLAKPEITTSPEQVTIRTRGLMASFKNARVETHANQVLIRLGAK